MSIISTTVNAFIIHRPYTVRIFAIGSSGVSCRTRCTLHWQSGQENDAAAGGQIAPMEGIPDSRSRLAARSVPLVFNTYIFIYKFILIFLTYNFFYICPYEFCIYALQTLYGHYGPEVSL